MKLITEDLLKNLNTEAELSLRKRKNYNFHDKLEDPLQRLLNAMEPCTYVQPHKHESPDKREFFIILKGKAVVVLFNENGDITNHVVLNPQTQNFGVEIPERTWHTIIILQTNTVLFEVKDGPYEVVSDKNFANWAPKENDPACEEYNNSILKRLKLL